jgi:plastocyanin
MRVLTTRFALGALVFGSVLVTADTAAAQLLPGRRARVAARHAAYADPCCQQAGYVTAGAAYGAGPGLIQPASYSQPAYYPSATTYGNPCCPGTGSVIYGGTQFRYGYGASMYFPSPSYGAPAYGGYAQPMPYAGGIHTSGYGTHPGAIPDGGIVPGQLPTRSVDATDPVRPDAGAVESKAVKILDGSFEPADLEVKVGTTVKWTNDGKKPHTVTSDRADWGSGELAGGQTFTATFTKPGSFEYHCKLHPDMKAKITVK